MVQLKLTANTPSEQRILEYLQNNASETLAEKINNGTPFEKDGKPLTNKKSLSGFMEYACSEARNLAAKDETAACVEDSVVYGWAIHYFEEDSHRRHVVHARRLGIYPRKKVRTRIRTNSKNKRCFCYSPHRFNAAKQTGIFIRYALFRAIRSRNSAA